MALNPATPLTAVQEVLPFIDLLLIMSVNPGFGGQKFIPTTLEKIRRARVLLEESGAEADLEVDGGVDSGNAAEIVQAGATVLVAGSAVYRHPAGPAEGVGAIRKAIEG